MAVDRDAAGVKAVQYGGAVSIEPQKRRVGRRGLSAFFGFVGVFLLAGGALDTRDTIDLTERRIESRRRATESQLVGRTEMARLTDREQAKLDTLNQRLYAMLGAAALALLLALVIAMTGAEPRWLALGMVAVAGGVWALSGLVAPVLPFFLAAFVAHVPDRIWQR